MFLLAPFFFVRKEWRALPGKGISAVYFAALGLGFMFFEITMIQRLVRFLGYPTYSLTVTLASILVFTGLGALLSNRFAAGRPSLMPVAARGARRPHALLRVRARRPHRLAARPEPRGPGPRRRSSSSPRSASASACSCRSGSAWSRSSADHGDEYVAWSWAVNGFFSVIGSVLTTILSMSFGFQAVQVIALGVYGIAVLAFLGLRRQAAGLDDHRTGRRVNPRVPTGGTGVRIHGRDRPSHLAPDDRGQRRGPRPRRARLHPARHSPRSAGGSTPGCSTTTASPTSSPRPPSSEEVRDYIADQATLRLARTSNFVSAARPVVTDAISAAVATPPVEDADPRLRVRAHEQVFQARGRADASTWTRSKPRRPSAARSRRSTRRWRRSCRPTSSTPSRPISQSDTVDLLFRISQWVRLWIPIGFLVGVALLVLALWQGRERVRAIRTRRRGRWRWPARCSLGLGAATPGSRASRRTADPCRGDAVAAFIEVLTGRLVGAGQALFVFGIALALGAGHDGGDLQDRWRGSARGSRRSARARGGGSPAGSRSGPRRAGAS